MRHQTRSPLTRYLALVEDADAGAGGAGGSGSGGAAGGGTATLTAEQQAAVDKATQAAVAKATKDAATAESTRIAGYLAEQKRIADLADADEITRLTAERDDAIAKQTAAETAAAHTAAESRARLALISAGMPAGTVDDGLRLVDLDPADDAAALTAKADALKARIPALFVPPTDAGEGAPGTIPPPAPGVVPPAQPAGSAGGKTGLEQGAEIARQLYPKPTAA